MKRMNQNIKQLNYQTLHDLLELLISHIFANSLGDSGNIKIVKNEIRSSNNF